MSKKLYVKQTLYLNIELCYLQCRLNQDIKRNKCLTLRFIYFFHISHTSYRITNPLHLSLNYEIVPLLSDFTIFLTIIIYFTSQHNYYAT